jgi:ribosomal protein S18 acetylase RimI-like enzyme
VQSALIARRIDDARAMGCRHLSVETAEDNPDKPAPSFHNVTRLGFRIAYYRDNYLGVTGS